MSNNSNEIVRWYRVDGMRLVTPASVGASWMLELTDSQGVATEAVWIVDDLPKRAIPREGSWGLFRLACYDIGLALSANFVTALIATLTA